MYKGIDISKHNGTVDFEKIKKSQDFVIIRLGYGSDKTSQDDGQYTRNIEQCEKYDIPYGVYLYSYALDVADAKSEVEHTLRLLKGTNPTLGVWFDMEDADGYKNKNNIPLNKANGELYTNICKTFTDGMIKAGYKHTGVYASKSVLDGILTKSYLESVKVWVAQWSSKCTYSGEYEIWQYADDGIVDGSSARTDMDYYYGELNSKNTSSTSSTSSTSNKSNVTYNYKVGNDVVISSYYEHSNYGISKAKYYNEPHPHFKIVEIINGAANPYRLSNDSFCNDGDIRSKYTSSNVYTKTDFIKEVQKILGAKVDGIAGSETLGKTITVSKKTNNKHKIVVPIQKRLTSLGYNVGTIDGIAGIKFETALKNYQKQYMKTPDGIITAKNRTWKKLLGMI